MIAKRIAHKTQCDHAQTPYQRRKCRAARLAQAASAAAENEVARQARISELGMSETDVIDWYAEAADHVAMLDGDRYDRHAAYWQGELTAARQAMTDLGLTASQPRRFGRRAA